MKFPDYISAYELYASGNEASPTFHSWGALSTISAAVGRRVWFDQAYYQIYPNLYVIFVGEPGDKKTTAMTIAKTLVQKTETPIAPASATKESITLLMSETNEKSPCKRTSVIGLELHESTHLSFFASEISTMLSAGGNALGLIEFFTDIYDQTVFEVMTKNKGTDIIKHPYVSMLACMTPEQTGQLLKQAIITGGFSRRVVFVYGRTQAAGIPFIKLSPEQKEAKQFLATELIAIAKGKWKGEFVVAPEAKTWYEAWYNAKHEEMRKPHPAVFKNWLKSKDVILLKISMLLVISEMRDPSDKVIQLRHLQRGLAMMDSVEPDLTRIFAGAGRNPGAELAHKINMQLQESLPRGLTRKQLLALFYHEGPTRDIDEALIFLVTTNKARLGAVPGAPQTQGASAYFATSKS